LAAHLAETAPVRPAYWTVESNLSGDKKASIAYQHVRGHRVMAEVEIPRAVVEDVLEEGHAVDPLPW